MRKKNEEDDDEEEEDEEEGAGGGIIPGVIDVWPCWGDSAAAGMKQTIIPAPCQHCSISASEKDCEMGREEEGPAIGGDGGALGRDRTEPVVAHLDDVQCPNRHCGRTTVGGGIGAPGREDIYIHIYIARIYTHSYI